MKKFIVIISCMLVCLGLVACNKEPEQPTDQQSEVQTVRFDCHEFDIESETKTDKILLTINLTDNFTASESLLFQDPTYYIGEYKKFDENGNPLRTISVYEYNNPDFKLVGNCSKISNSWYIENASMMNDDAYTRQFYTTVDKYVIGLNITNNTKEPLSVDDAIKLIAFMSGEECHEPEPVEEQSVIVDATIDNPARLGEWVSTVAYNKATRTYEPVCVCITDVITGELANTFMEDYNNTHPELENAYYVANPTEQEFVIYKYAVYFPKSFTASSDGQIHNVTIPISICNKKDNGLAIGSSTQLVNTVTDLSEAMNNVTNGSIWYDGVGYYEMDIDFDSYFIKLDPDDNITDTKYFTYK